MVQKKTRENKSTYLYETGEQHSFWGQKEELLEDGNLVVQKPIIPPACDCEPTIPENTIADNCQEPTVINNPDDEEQPVPLPPATNIPDVLSSEDEQSQPEESIEDHIEPQGPDEITEEPAPRPLSPNTIVWKPFPKPLKSDNT